LAISQTDIQKRSTVNIDVYTAKTAIFDQYVTCKSKMYFRLQIKTDPQMEPETPLQGTNLVATWICVAFISRIGDNPATPRNAKRETRTRILPVRTKSNASTCETTTSEERTLSPMGHCLSTVKYRHCNVGRTCIQPGVNGMIQPDYGGQPALTFDPRLMPAFPIQHFYSVSLRRQIAIN
jgi:hypothetical protein